MMRVAITVWPGTDADLKKLQDAVNRNCMCVDAEGTCAAHRLLVDQDVLNHLAFVAGCREVYRRAEFYPPAEFGLD